MSETRVLVAARLSRLVKGRDQLSIERQDDTARKYAAEVGDDSPIVVPDPGVSGSVSPFKRPKLGPYLNEKDHPELVDSWTELVASAIDRLGRNARDLAELRAWCEDHGKQITVLSPRLHWPPDEGDFGSRIVWVVLEELAEIELRQTKKRYADTRAMLRERKSMLGKPVWGFRITGGKASKTLTPDPAKVPYLLHMIDMAFEDESLADITRWLDAEGAKPRHGGKWDPKSVGQILRNESLYGVRRENGKILQRHQGVISKERWDKLQAKLDSRPSRRGPTRNEPMELTDVLYCLKCERIMHARRIAASSPRKDGTRRIWVGYRCDGTAKEPSTCKNMIPADDIESWVDMWATASSEGDPDIFAFGDREIVETVHVPAKGHADEVAEIEAQIKELDLDDPDFDVKLADLRAERARLIALGTEPAHTEDRPTGIFLGDYWLTLDAAKKRDYLIRAGIRIYAVSSEHGDEVEGPFRRLIGDPARVVGALRMPAETSPKLSDS
jgi:DNA invertase Pin-like site-specific DNA recombinase